MLPWDATKRLLRLQGVAEELLNTARSSGGAADQALGAQVNTIAGEVHSILSQYDVELAGEFESMLSRASGDAVPADVSASVLVGWLRAGLTTQSLDEQRTAAAPPPETRRRKQTIGFKIRSPITREPDPGDAER